jgi:hypothetical protein
MNRYVNMKDNPLKIQAEHGTEVAAIVMRLRGMPLWYALVKLTGRVVKENI